jgi:hypothetical protein
MNLSRETKIVDKKMVARIKTDAYDTTRKLERGLDVASAA